MTTVLSDKIGQRPQNDLNATNHALIMATAARTLVKPDGVHRIIAHQKGASSAVNIRIVGYRQE